MLRRCQNLPQAATDATTKDKFKLDDEQTNEQAIEQII